MSTALFTEILAGNQDFKTGPAGSNLIPVVRAMPADLETPVSVYLKLAGEGASFLLESVTGGEQVARYSFIGSGLTQALVMRDRRLERHTRRGVEEIPLPDRLDVLDMLRAELDRFQPAPAAGLPRFAGGLVGYLGYDAIPGFEPSVPLSPPGAPEEARDLIPEAVFLMADTLVAFDHAFGRLLLIANAHPDDPGPDGSGRARAVAAAQARLDELERRLAEPLPGQPAAPRAPEPGELVSNTGRGEFIRAVLAAKEQIAAGEIFQVVLSQRFSRRTAAAPFEIYRALRRLNPSPYMFYFDFGSLAGDPPLRLIGASPEMHVRLEGRRACLRPIAGTRPRGRTPGEDAALAEELLADPKERAEHVMLVDLARNDLGRVCAYGSVRVSDFMGIERYSHVMHIVSQVDGQLREGLDGFDLLRATFPAGTVSGAPKIRAMQLIAGLEHQRRGLYAGAVGYCSHDGSLDTCIAIRTLVMRGQQISIQAGAGIVADSDPEREYQETVNKARALAEAVALAEQAAGRQSGSSPEEAV